MRNTINFVGVYKYEIIPLLPEKLEKTHKKSLRKACTLSCVKTQRARCGIYGHTGIKLGMAT